MSLALRTRLGPYEIAGSLGAGGMGEVYRAKDTRLGRTVAIKVLPPDLAANPERRRRFEQEARAVSALNHPHICILYDIGSATPSDAPGAAATDYLVMEFLEGQTLAERLEKGPLPLREVLEYGTQVADALSKAHRQGILHRDIKPGNVMVTKAGAKLLDFGLAKARPGSGALDVGETVSMTRGPVTSAGLVVGTVPYMAPEVLQGKDADARADIFALGALLYEMASGRRAFAGDNQASLIAAILTSDPAPLTTTGTWGSGFSRIQSGDNAPSASVGSGPGGPNALVPSALDRLIRRCLAKDPDDRWQSAGDIARLLEGIAEELKLPASSMQVPVVAPAATPRRRAAAWIVAGALALAVPAVMFIVGQRTGARPQPTFHRLTFRQGSIEGARFTPDGLNVIYTARFEGNPRETFTVRTDGVDSEPRPTLKGLAVEAISTRSEIAGLRGNTLATAPLAGGAPRDLTKFVNSADWGPDGSQLAVTRWTDAGRAIEYPAGHVVYRPADAGINVDGVRVSPRGDLLAFREHFNTHGRVVVIDLAGKTRAASGFVDGIRQPAWSADGKEVWFSGATAAGMETVRALDLSGRERTALRSPGLVLHDVGRDGRVLLASTSTIYSIFGRAPGEATDRNLTYYGWSLLDDMSPDGKSILFTEGGDSDPANGWSIFLRPTDGSLPQSIGRGHYAYGRLSPDGKWVAAQTFKDRRSAVTLVPTGAGEERLVTGFDDPVDSVVGWLPDGSAFLFHSGNRVWLAPLDGAPRAITPQGWLIRPNNAPAPGMIAPDGRHFICGNDVPGDNWGYLCAVDAPVDSSLPKVVDMGKWAPVGWTGDGTKLFVMALPMGVPLRVLLLDPATGTVQPWKEIGGQIDRTGLVAGLSRVRFSADGESYAYTFGRRMSTLYVAEGVR